MNQHPIIFLDVDGVLNSYDQLEESKRLRGMAPKHVAELARILRETKSFVVVSSTWRLGGIDAGSRFFLELQSHGSAGELVLTRVIGRTPDYWTAKSTMEAKCRFGKPIRGDEIAHWREEHDHVGPFVIIDDDSDMGHLTPFLVKTDNQYGLTSERADEVIRRFSCGDREYESSGRIKSA